MTDADADIVLPLDVLRRWWGLLLVAGVMGAVLGGLFARSQPARYETKVGVLVGPVFPDGDLLEGTADLARTFGEVIESDRVRLAAVEGLSVKASTVELSAAAGRGSLTLSIVATSPSRSDTPKIAIASIEALRVIIAESQSSRPQAGFAALGTELTVIDDGAGRAKNTAIQPVVGAALGVFTVLLAVGAFVLAIESRRAARPTSTVLERYLSTDLGRLETPPTVGWPLRSRSNPHLNTADRSIHESNLVAERIARSMSGDSTPTVFVASPRMETRDVEAVIQLCAGFAEPPTIVDPHGLIAVVLLPHAERGVPKQLTLTSDGMTIAKLLVPAPSSANGCVDPESVLDKCRNDSQGRTPVLVVSLADSSTPSWREWAICCDAATVLLRTAHQRKAIIGPLAVRLSGMQSNLLGGILVRPPLFGRSATIVSVADLVEPDRQGGPTGPAELQGVGA